MSNPPLQGKGNSDKDFSYEGKVIIKPNAYITMISHVLRFGSEDLEKCVQVLGICIGKITEKGKKLILHEAIPISHGSEIDIEFTEQNYKDFESIKEESRKKDMFIIGWYHSHPNLGLNFSKIDIKNHLYWQGAQNPYAFSLIFDHSLMRKSSSSGLKSFRLDDFKLGEQSNYHELKIELEPPRSLEYFKTVQRLVEDSQKKIPIITKELNEIGELQEIPKPLEGEIIEEKLKSPLKPTIDGFLKGTQEFNQIFLSKFQEQIDNWVNDITVGTSKSSVFMANTVSLMQNSIDKGIKKVKNWFKNTISTQMDEFKVAVRNQIQKRIDLEIELTKEIHDKTDEIVDDILKIVNENIAQNLTEIGEKIKQNSTVLKDLEKNQEGITNEINSQTNLAKTMNEITETAVTEINQQVNMISTKIDESFNENFKDISMGLSSIKERTEKLDNLLETLLKSVKNLKKM